MLSGNGACIYRIYTYIRTYLVARDRRSSQLGPRSTSSYVVRSDSGDHHNYPAHIYRLIHRGGAAIGGGGARHRPAYASYSVQSKYVEGQSFSEWHDK
jgi:hypothetical protein